MAKVRSKILSEYVVLIEADGRLSQNGRLALYVFYLYINTNLSYYPKITFITEQTAKHFIYIRMYTPQNKSSFLLSTI